MKLLKPLLTGILLLGLIGCASVFTTTITVTKIVDDAMRQWAHLSNTHQTSPALDANVIAAHDRYRMVAGIAQASMKAYQASGNPTDLATAIAQAKGAAMPIIDLIASILQPTQSAALKQSLTKVTAP